MGADNGEQSIWGRSEQDSINKKELSQEDINAIGRNLVYK